MAKIHNILRMGGATSKIVCKLLADGYWSQSLDGLVRRELGVRAKMAKTRPQTRLRVQGLFFGFFWKLLFHKKIV